MTKKVAILGSNSFAGRQCVACFSAKGYEVIGVSRSELPDKLFFEFDASFDYSFDFANYQFFELDINHDWDRLKHILVEKKPEIIIDMAGQGMVAESWQNPAQWYQTNILAKIEMHQWLKSVDWLDRYIRVSTPEVYGSHPGTIKEDCPYSPSTPYAVSHAAIDMSLNTFYQQYEFPVVLTRFANFYGPCQQLYRIIPRAFIYAELNKKLQLHGGGTSMRAFIHGHDVATALLAVIEKGSNGSVYHFSTDEIISIRELVQLIAEQRGMALEDLCEVSEDRPGKDARYFMDFGKAKDQLDWQPSVTLQQGLQQVGEWVQRNIDDISTRSLNYEHQA